VIPNLDWGRFQAVLFDVDGTLYDQRQLRRIMAVELASWCLFHPLRLREAKILATFRRLREANFAREEASLEEAQYRWTAEALGADAAEVRRVADEWLLRRPLRHLRRCRPPGLAELFARLRSQNIKIGVFSDYPAEEKLSALELKADVVACALDIQINRLKPNPLGLHYVLRQFQLAPSRALHIGDREDRDALCAERCGCASLLLPARRAGIPSGSNQYDRLFPT
jgi:FMN phosphatase YigB (HAD superfamily)